MGFEFKGLGPDYRQSEDNRIEKNVEAFNGILVWKGVRIGIVL